MVSIQYILDGHTSVYLADSRDKKKVSNWEIIEVTNEQAEALKYRGFKILKVSVKSEEDGRDDITIEVKKKNKTTK